MRFLATWLVVFTRQSELYKNENRPTIPGPRAIVHSASTITPFCSIFSATMRRSTVNRGKVLACLIRRAPKGGLRKKAVSKRPEVALQTSSNDEMAMSVRILI